MLVLVAEGDAVGERLDVAVLLGEGVLGGELVERPEPVEEDAGHDAEERPLNDPLALVQSPAELNLGLIAKNCAVPVS